MKTAKNLFALALALLMVLSFATPVFAAEAQFDSTRSFLEGMNGFSDVTCTVQGVAEDGNGAKQELVSIVYEGEMAKQPVNITACFPENNESVLFRVYNLMEVEDEQLMDILGRVNVINAAYSWVKFYVDFEDMSVTAESDVIIRPEVTADIGGAALVHLITVTESAMQLLKEAA